MVTILKKGSDINTIKTVMEKVSKGKSKKGLYAAKYAGTVKFKEDGLALQKRLRDEWE